MGHSKSASIKVRRLSQKICDETITEDEIAELNELLHKPEMRQVYLRMMNLHQALERKQARGTLAPLEDQKDNHAALLGNTCHLLMDDLDKKLEEARPKRSLAVILTLAAALVLCGLLLFSIRPEEVAKLVKVVEGSVPATSSVINKNQILKLESGIASYRTNEGVLVVIEAPFEGTFLNSKELKLNSGKLYAEVPEEGKGFTVKTPSGKVVDHGTRFGVYIKETQKTEVHVFEGAVSTHIVDSKLDLIAGDAVIMKAGEKISYTELDEVPFRNLSGTFYEPFSHWRKEPESGWILSPPAVLSTNKQRTTNIDKSRSLNYPGLKTGGQGSLFLPGSEPAPIGHRWLHEYTSFIFYFDDDLPKQLRNELQTIVSFGESDLSSEKKVRLVANATKDRQMSIGLQSAKETIYSESNFSYTQIIFIVMRRNQNKVDLWVNPPAETLGMANPPGPDVSIEIDSSSSNNVLWLCDPSNPVRNNSYWWLDELRGGQYWESVTPKE